jgi:hypothetical protein
MSALGQIKLVLCIQGANKTVLLRSVLKTKTGSTFQTSSKGFPPSPIESLTYLEASKLPKAELGTVATVSSYIQ